MMRIAILTTDNRGQYRKFDEKCPMFGPAPEALLAGLARCQDIEVHVISPIRNPVESPTMLAGNVYFHSLHVPKLGWMSSGYLGCLRAYRRKLTQIQPDLVHGQGSEFGEALGAAYSGFRNVVTLLGIMSEMAKVMKARPGSFYWLAALLESRALRRTMGVLANSRFTEEKVRSRTRKTWVVPNAIRGSFFTTPLAHGDSKVPVLLNVGLVSPYKRQNELLAVAEDLWREGYDFKLRFIGGVSGGDSYVDEFNHRLRRNPNAQWDGQMSEQALIAAYDQASALVHVSKIETFGLVVAEALARNLKLFAFANGGVADIGKGVDGADLHPDEDWTGLKAAIQRWLKAGAPRSANAAATARLRYHPEEIARQHLNVYREVLA